MPFYAKTDTIKLCKCERLEYCSDLFFYSIIYCIPELIPDALKMVKSTSITLIEI